MSENQPVSPSREGNASFVRWLARWAVITSLLIIIFDVAILRNYPFPVGSQGLRAVFYSVYGFGLIVASLGFAFLGYRIVSLRYARHAKAIYLIFLPPVLLVTSLVWLLLLARAG